MDEQEIKNAALEMIVTSNRQVNGMASQLQAAMAGLSEICKLVGVPDNSRIDHVVEAVAAAVEGNKD